MSIAEQVNDILVEALSPARLDVINESHLHNVPPGSESHFKLLVVSPDFAAVSLVNRHRMINTLLRQQLEHGIHALSMHTYTPEEWAARGGEVPSSPPCLGGKAREGS